MTTIETVPTLELTPDDLAGVADELSAYHAIFAPLYTRREQREWALLYQRGLVSDLPRKSVEPIVLSLHGADENAIRAVQQFVNAGAWNDTAILQRHWQQVDEEIGDADGLILVDGSDFPKKGTESVGVQRQYCGQLGKRANCQAGVFLGYASAHGSTLLDRRLYLPEPWVSDPAFAERRRKCGLPDDISFKTKPALALEMLQAVVQAGTLRARWLACDEGFGRDTGFLSAVAELGLYFIAEVPHDTRVWTERPETAVPVWRGRGPKPSKARVVAEAPAPLTVRALADAVPAAEWQEVAFAEGAKGVQVADIKLLRVVSVRDGLPGPEVWLLLRINRETGELKTFVSNAPEDVAAERLIRVSAMRWPIEACFETGKQVLGMGDYEIRSWVGWHHHMTLVILAHGFLMRLHRRLKKSQAN